MRDPLAIYLEDHLAGATYAVDLLGALRDQHTGESLGQFAAAMLVEVEADTAILQELNERVGSTHSGLKAASGWIAEKVSRLKLKHDGADGLGTFQALEFLTVGIQGKLALWRALAEVSPGDARLQHLDLDHLVERAEIQHSRMEERRLEAARTALQPTKE